MASASRLRPSIGRFLEGACEKADDMANISGFFGHPLWTQAVAEKKDKRRKMVLVEYILYDLDAESQFDKMVAVEAKRKERATEHHRGTFVPPIRKMAPETAAFQRLYDLDAE